MTYSKSHKTNVVVDIETIVNPVTAQEVSDYMQTWEPPGSVKLPETVLRYRVEAETNAVNTISDKKRFTIGGKRMVSAALGQVTENGDVVDVESWQSEQLADITKGIVNYLDSVGEYRLIGWNHTEFDLPEIVKSFYLTSTKPKRKPSKWDIIDLCGFPFRRKALKDIAKGFGLELMGIDGSAIDKLYEQKEWSKIKEYNEYDVGLTGKVFAIANTLYSFY